jgi:arabinogalactan endo-1,4-beta-galactosidase
MYQCPNPPTNPPVPAMHLPSNLHGLRRVVARACFIVLPFLTPLAAPGAGASHYAIGADVSFLAQAEASGTVFKDEGVAKPGLQILKDHGYNWVRLRLFHTPSNSQRFPLPNDLAYTIALAQQAKALGYKFLLNFHYSDTWADPAKQTLPEAWKDLSQAELVDAV